MLKRSVCACPIPGVLLLLMLAWPGGMAAQTGIVRVERENFRAAPRGVVLAEVEADTRLALGEDRDRWREATLEGWIWAASVREEAADGHDLVVTTVSGENLRAGPNGRILARLRQGMRLDRVGGDGPWLRVRRSGWIWEPSLAVEEVRPAAQAAPVPEPGPGESVTAPAESSPRSAGSSAGGRRFATTASGLTVLVTPAGDTVARVAPGATVEIVGGEGRWSRVRIEGWASTAALGGDTATGTVLADVTPAQLRSNPELYRGRVIEWTVQFIALQQAERFRSDFVEGEPFMLTRGPGEDAGFVYVAVPQDRLDAVRRLTPLQRVRLMGRIRAPASSLTGAPVLDLIDLQALDR